MRWMENKNFIEVNLMFVYENLYLNLRISQNKTTKSNNVTRGLIASHTTGNQSIL